MTQSFDEAPLKIAILASGHPAQEGTRAAHAAYGLFKRLKGVPELAPVFIAAEPLENARKAGRVRLHEGRTDELILSVPRLDRRMLFASDGRGLETLLGGVLSRLQPDLVHVHHQGGFGLDSLRIAADFWIPTALTLYDGLEGGEIAGGGSEGEDPSIRFVRRRLLSETLETARAIVMPNRLLAAKLAAVLTIDIEQRVIESIDNAEPDIAQSRPKATRWSAARATSPKNKAQTPIRCGFFAASTNAPGVQTFKAGVDLLPKDQLSLLDLGVYTHASLVEKKAGAKDAIELRDSSDTRLQRIREAVAICDCVAVADLEDSIGFSAVQEAISLGIPVLSPHSDELTGIGSYQYGPKAADVAVSLIDLCELWAEQRLLPSSRHDTDEEIVQQHVSLYRRIVFGSVEDDVEPSAPEDIAPSPATTVASAAPAVQAVTPQHDGAALPSTPKPTPVEIIDSTRPIDISPVTLAVAAASDADLAQSLSVAEIETSAVTEQVSINEILQADPTSGEMAAANYTVEMSGTVALPVNGGPGKLNQFWSKLKKSLASSSAS